jgi:hypothetical protein
MLQKIENATIHKYGYEHCITQIVFRITHILRKVIGD